MFGCVGYIFLSIVELAIVGMLEKPTSKSIDSDIGDSTNLLLNEPQSDRRLFKESRRRKKVP